MRRRGRARQARDEVIDTAILNSARMLERAAGDLQEPKGNRQFMALTQ